MIFMTGYYWIIRLSTSSVGITVNDSIYSLISCGKGRVQISLFTTWVKRKKNVDKDKFNSAYNKFDRIEIVI